MTTSSNVTRTWPDESKEAAQLVVDKYGEPDEATPSALTWHGPGPWKRIVASREFYRHEFPTPLASAPRAGHPIPTPEW